VQRIRNNRDGFFDALVRLDDRAQQPRTQIGSAEAPLDPSDVGAAIVRSQTGFNTICF
jgi:hypothetical protein